MSQGRDELRKNVITLGEGGGEEGGKGYREENAVPPGHSKNEQPPIASGGKEGSAGQVINEAMEGVPLIHAANEMEDSVNEGKSGTNKEVEAMLTAVEREFCMVGLYDLPVGFSDLIGGQEMGSMKAATTFENEEEEQEEGATASLTTGASNLQVLLRSTKVLLSTLAFFIFFEEACGLLAALIGRFIYSSRHHV